MRQLEEQGVNTADIREIVACIYADDGLIAARDPTTLQDAIDDLVALFERVGLKTNTGKTEAMTFVPGRIRTPLTEEAYQARMSDFHREERKGCRVVCHVCEEEMAVGSLASHLATQHDIYQCYVAPGANQAGSGDGTTWTARFFPAEGAYR